MYLNLNAGDSDFRCCYRVLVFQQSVEYMFSHFVFLPISDQQAVPSNLLNDILSCLNLVELVSVGL
jgi:hypothetical protein